MMDERDVGGVGTGSAADNHEPVHVRRPEGAPQALFSQGENSAGRPSLTDTTHDRWFPEEDHTAGSAPRRKRDTMSTRRTKRPLLAGVGALLGAAALVLSGAVTAQAHVSLAEDTVEAGAYEILTLSVPHGCDGSATTELAIQIPEGINAVTPTRNSLYTVDKVMAELDTPITDSHGNEVTERVAQIVYTADTPLPDGQRDAFELSLQVPEDAADSTLYFPTVQTCEEGETAWVQIPEDGQDAHDLESPAPSVEVVAAEEAD